MPRLRTRMLRAATPAAVALLVCTSAAAAAPLGSGKSVAYGLSRSGSAGAAAGACGSRLQCFKTAITDANAATTPLVENVALVMINVAEPDQDVNMKLAGKQLLIPPDADPSLNGKPDFIDALNKVSLGGGTCFTCALQAAERGFAGARPDSDKVIVLVSERPNVFASTGFTSTGAPASYEPMEMQQMASHFDARTVVRAFAVGPDVTCAADPNGYGSLDEAAAVTPGGTCANIASFDGLGPSLTEAVSGGAAGPDLAPPAVTLTSPTAGGFTQDTPTFSGGAGTATGDEATVTVRLWEGSDTAAPPLQTQLALATAGVWSVPASPALTPGPYTVQAEQVDAAGNVGRTPPVAFTVLPPSPTPVAYADEVRADVPRAYWRLGELSGTTAAEDQGGPSGTYSGGVVLGVDPALHGDANRAAHFDGGNDKMAVPDPASGSLDFGTSDFTAEAWIRPAASDERGVIAKRSANAAEPYWAVTVTDDPNHNGQIRAVLFDGTSTRTAYSSKGVVDGAWHHVVVWYDRDSGITISVDGTSKFTALGMAPDVSNTGPVEVGKAPANPYFKGDIDEVAVYGGLLPVHRIKAHSDAAGVP